MTYTVDMKVLVIEDDQKINAFINRGLRESGMMVESATDGLTGLRMIQEDPSIDLAILDLMLPGLSGLELLTKIREEGYQIPVIILSAKKSVDDKVAGLQRGADDYLVKPFSFSELLARVQALTRRNQSQTTQSTRLEKFGIVVDLLSRKVTRDGQEIDLQPKEFSLLEYFMRNPDRVLSKTMILETVYGYDFDPRTNVVDVLVCRLRNKLDHDGARKSIQTIRGMGYVLKSE